MKSGSSASSATKSAGASGGSDWASTKAPSGETYFYNKKTKEVSWDPPPGFDPASVDAKPAAAAPPAVVSSQNVAAPAGNPAPGLVKATAAQFGGTQNAPGKAQPPAVSAPPPVSSNVTLPGKAQPGPPSAGKFGASAAPAPSIPTSIPARPLVSASPAVTNSQGSGYPPPPVQPAYPTTPHYDIPSASHPGPSSSFPQSAPLAAQTYKAPTVTSGTPSLSSGFSNPLKPPSTSSFTGGVPPPPPEHLYSPPPPYPPSQSPAFVPTLPAPAFPNGPPPRKTPTEHVREATDSTLADSERKAILKDGGTRLNLTLEVTSHDAKRPDFKQKLKSEIAYASFLDPEQIHLDDVLTGPTHTLVSVTMVPDMTRMHRSNTPSQASKALAECVKSKNHVDAHYLRMASACEIVVDGEEIKQMRNSFSKEYFDMKDKYEKLKLMPMDQPPPVVPPVAVKEPSKESSPAPVSSPKPAPSMGLPRFLPPAPMPMPAPLPPAPASAPPAKRLYACSLGTGFVGTYEEVQAHEQRILASQQQGGWATVQTPNFGPPATPAMAPPVQQFPQPYAGQGFAPPQGFAPAPNYAPMPQGGEYYGQGMPGGYPGIPQGVAGW